MRIAVVGNFGLAGNQTMAARAVPLAELLAARHEVLVVLPERRAGDLEAAAEPRAVPVKLVRAWPSLRIPCYLLQAASMTWHCLRWQPTLLYCYKPIAHSWAVLLAFWLLRRVRLFKGTLALDTDDWEGYGGWNARQPFPGWVKRLVAWQERWSLRHADLVTAASRELSQMAEKLGAREVHYVPNALPVREVVSSGEPADELRRRLGLSGRRVVLAYTRFVEFGVERLLNVFERVARAIPEASLLVVGTGLRAEEERLEALSVERGLRGRLVLAGWVTPEDLPGYFRIAELALYLMDDTLLNRTKCPVKLLELLAAGIPVVADGVGEARTYLRDGETGVLVSPGDADGMARAASELLADATARERIGNRAREEARTRRTWDALAPELESALIRLAAGGSR